GSIQFRLPVRRLVLDPPHKEGHRIRGDVSNRLDGVGIQAKNSDLAFHPDNSEPFHPLTQLLPPILRLALAPEKGHQHPSEHGTEQDQENTSLAHGSSNMPSPHSKASGNAKAEKNSEEQTKLGTFCGKTAPHPNPLPWG